ncbi:MAG: NAD(P)-binding domain-containing protein, partial [Ktedonobacterales bacterium]
MDMLITRIQQRRAVVSVVGLGYVGLPLAVEFARAGFRVIGFDVDEMRVASLNAGLCYIPDVDGAVFQQQVESGTFTATTDFTRLAEADTITICVPTPLRKTKDPDISYVVAAAERVAQTLHSQQLIVLES